MIDEYLDTLSIEELEKLSKEIIFRIKNQRLIKERTADINDIDLSVRAIHCLKNAGIKTMMELNKMSSDEVLKIKNMGKKTVKELSEYFDYLGMDWDCEF